LGFAISAGQNVHEQHPAAVHAQPISGHTGSDGEHATLVWKALPMILQGAMALLTVSCGTAALHLTPLYCSAIIVPGCPLHAVGLPD
jgi:hypothetical protein